MAKCTITVRNLSTGEQSTRHAAFTSPVERHKVLDELAEQVEGLMSVDSDERRGLASWLAWWLTDNGWKLGLEPGTTATVDAIHKRIGQKDDAESVVRLALKCWGMSPSEAKNVFSYRDKRRKRNGDE